MKWRRAWLFVALYAGLALGRAEEDKRVEGGQAESRQSSISQSRQFIVYGMDVPVRALVNSRADEAKSRVLELLGEGDQWKVPVVITLKRAAAWGANTVKWIDTADGPSMQIHVQIGDGPAGVDLRKQIVQAVLLDMSYRNRPRLKPGVNPVEPPWWMVSGVLQSLQREERGESADLFKGIIETNKVPEIGDFLKLHTEEVGAAAQAVDGAYALCLIQLLTEQPDGKAALGRLIRRWPDLQADPLGALLKEFRTLGANANDLQKWWTLSMARLSEADRYKGLSTEETDKQLRQLLSVEMVVNKAGDKKTFGVGQFKEFMGLPGCKPALVAAHGAIVALGTRCHALFRPVLADYEKIFSLLANGKPKGVAERIVEAERYRELVTRRIGEIADYLNWYELTQLGTQSKAFDSYMKTANDLRREEERARREDPVTKYLDALEKEY